MKFKKVEISAFRIYNDPANATFDLTTKSGDAAGFVSLYAPNGFGKTSFYDAVEFGVTNSINRFFIRSKELEKLANFQLNQNEVPLIRNSKSTPDRNTYVRIFTTSEVDPEIYRLFQKHGNQTHDLNFNKRPIPHKFQNVILSQEWIGAFLTEQDGEYRYEKFMEIPELSSINEYYNKLKQAFSVLETKKNRLKDDITQFEKSIQNLDSENLLDTVNNQIKLLTEKFGEQFLIFLSITSTQEDIKKLKDILANRTISNNHELSLLHLLEDVDTAKSGNNVLVGFKPYFSIQEANQKGNNRLLEIQPILEKFDSLEKIRIEIDNVEKSQQDHRIDKNGVINTISDFTEYDRVLKEIREKDSIISKAEAINNDTNKHLSELRGTEIKLRSQLETVFRELEELANKKAKIPDMKVEFERLNTLILKTEDELSDKKGYIDIKEKEQRELESKITNLQRIITEVTNGQYPQTSQDKDTEIDELVKKIRENELLLSNENATLKSLNATIKQQETLNRIITDFIKTGLSFVNEQKSSACPLCEQVYDSYNVLVEKITNNKALEEGLKILLLQKSKSELRTSELIINIKENRDKFLDFYKEQVEKLSIKNKNEKQISASLKRDIKNVEMELDILKQKTESQKIDLNGLTFDAFEKQIDYKKAEANKTKDLINPKVTANNEAIDKCKEQLESLKSQIILLKEEIAILTKNEKYINVIEWFNKHFPNKEINKELITEKDIAMAKNISQLVLKQKEIDEKINIFNQELSSFKKENLLQEEMELKKLIYENDVKISGYQYFLKDKLDIDSSQLTETTLPKILEERQKKYKADLEHTTSIREEYQKLEKYSDNVWPFLQSENAKLDLANAIKELDFLIYKVETVIKEEREKTKGYLNNRIKNFFHEDLINKLYRKIDPHPDFKSVVFKANFDTDNPRLDVFVKNTKNENFLIPNLYFSTAQINILSLSIFLATALNSKDYQCIFIDDPIQSMDSVNVLSTIDLLRSIVVNEEKQIILSTHDENFHNLLKKKMPPELFDSKFLELESFGKLKA